MYQIKTLNPISKVINDYLAQTKYQITNDAKKPEGILVRSASMHEYEINNELLCVARAGAGYNNIPYKEYAKKGIVVFNTPGANANGVKELVMCGLLLSARKVVDGINWAQTLKGEGDAVAKLIEKGKKNFAGGEVSGKKLGIIGMGAIGAMVANAALALDMEVTGFDPFMSIESALSLSRSVNRDTDEDAIYKNSDYITLHLPLIPETKHKINKDTLAKCKDGVVILNFARGELVDSAAIIEALLSGKVSKYITDFPTEDLLNVEGVIAIPHLGASTVESEENCAVMAAKQMRDYIENGNITNSVNLPTCVQARSSANRIAIVHENVKNMVGQITTALADENLNISNMINKSCGDIAYTMLDVDNAPSDAWFKAINEIKGIIKVRFLKKQ